MPPLTPARCRVQIGWTGSAVGRLVVEAISKQMGERPTDERNAADPHSGLEFAHLGDEPTVAQVGHQQVEAAQFEIAPWAPRIPESELL